MTNSVEPETVKNVQEQSFAGIPKISVIIPVFNASQFLERCLKAVTSSAYDNYEVCVVDDNSTDGSREIAQRFPVRVLLQKDGPCGPAHARNFGAQSANGEIIFFIDADVAVHPNTIHKVANNFSVFPQYDAVFGSYDDNPSHPEFLSQYKNLYHHYVHQSANEEGSTFWSGCGAIRRRVFSEMGGFDVERYPRPSIEDIELGARLRNAGHRIRVDKDVQVQHMKRWTLANLIKTDVFDRAIPWTQLILRQRNLPNDLNLQTSQRASAILLSLLLISLMISWNFQMLVLGPIWAVIVLMLLSSWKLDEPQFLGLSGRERIFTFGLLILTSGFVLIGNTIQLLPLLGILAVLMAVGLYLPFSNRSIKLVLLVMMLATLGAGFGVLLSYGPIWIPITVLFLSALILLLNLPLYSFFFRKRGILFTLSAIPFQLFYYFYSLVAFVFGAGIHFWNVDIKSNR